MAGALHLDKETNSAADLPKVGAHRYAQDPTTSIILASFQFEGGPLDGWLDDLPPQAVVEHVRTGGRVVGHNAAFERSMWNARVAPLTGAYMVPEQQDCTMARAAAMGLPQGLDALAKALKLNIQKDSEGRTLMLRMCKHGYQPKPGELERLGLYCDVDVKVETQFDATLPQLSERERRVWILDQKINDRGFKIDVERAYVAQQVVDEAKKAADRRMWEITDGAVPKASQVGKLVDWLNHRGVTTQSIADGEIDSLILTSQLFSDDAAEAALRCRRESAGAFKFQAMLAAVCADGRVRGSLAYHGTHGGRWAGRVVQPQNMKRMDTDEDVAAAATAIELLGSKRPAHEILTAIDMMAGPPLEVLSLCARPMIIAETGKRLFDADFSNIEGRLAAWFAGAHWKLDAFRSYDAGTGPDLYRVTASSVLGIPIEQVGRFERQLFGKVPELAGGYQGGIKAIQKAGAKGGLFIPAGQAAQIRDGYRDGNPELVDAWAGLNDAAIEAVQHPGMVVPALGGKVRYTSDGNFLYCLLPSGRITHYASPSVGWKTRIYTEDGDLIDEKIAEALPLAEQAKLSESHRLGVSYWGSKNGRLMKLDLYGGAQFAHIVSGTARDVLVEAMFAVEAEDYPLVLSVHDEGLSEAEKGSAADYERIIVASKPKWIGDAPLVAKAWEDTRYCK